MSHLAELTKHSSLTSSIPGARAQLDLLREEVLRVAARHLASNLRVFGSVARGEEGPDSDIDLLVDFAPQASLLDLIAMKHELEQLLQRRTDVVTVNGVSPFLRQKILDEARPL